MTDDTKQPRYEVLDLTPELIEQLLTRNPVNRTVREYKVETYLADMLAGRWHLAEPLLVDWNGQLVTGQHRLLAARRYYEQTGTPLRASVLWNVDPAARDTVDTGMPQKFGDLLKVYGEPRYTTLAAVALKVFKHELGDRGQDTKKRTASNYQLLDVIERYPELRELVEHAHRWGARGPLPGSITGYLAWRFLRCVPELSTRGLTNEDVYYFFDHLSEDAGHEDGKAVTQLRRAVLNAKKAGHRPKNPWMTALTIRAWNHYVEGNQVKKLVYRSGGAGGPEAFPVPLGEVD